MAVNYTTKYAKKIAERFHRRSITDAACGHDYSFVGAKTVKIIYICARKKLRYASNV